MKTYQYTFTISEKEIYDYETRTFKKITYNPKINQDIFQKIRNVFERGISGEKHWFVRYFVIKEDSIGNTITITTDANYDFDEYKVFAVVKPMRKKDYAKFSFKITSITKHNEK